MDAHPNPRNRVDSELIFSTPLPEPSSAAASASSARSLTTDTASPFEPLCSGSYPRNGAPYSKKKTVLLCDWWLLWAPEAHEGRRLSVGGVVAERYKGPCRHKVDRSGSKFLLSPWQKAERVFESAPITKRYDSFTLGTADGITVRIQGVINKACSHQNGIPLEVCNSFLIGFPYNWDKYAGACFEGKFNAASVPESAASANEISKGLADPEGCLFPVLLDDFSLSRIHDGSVDDSVTRKFSDFLEKFCYTTIGFRKPLASDVRNCSLLLVQSGLPHEPPSKYERATVLAQVIEGLEHVARFEEFSSLSPRDHQTILVEGLDLSPPWKRISEKEKYEKERIRQKHGNGSNHVGGAYVVGPPEAAGCYIDGLQGDEVDGGNLITAHTENNVSLDSSLYLTSQVNTLPIKVADVQKISLENIPELDNCIRLTTSVRVSMDTVDLMPSCTGEAYIESSSSLGDGVITENFIHITSEVQQNVSLDSTLHLTSQVDRQVPTSENKPEPDNCIHLAGSVTVSLDTVNGIPNYIGEANNDINTGLADSGIESIVAVMLSEEFNLHNSKHAKEFRNARRSDDSERIWEHDIALSEGFLAREVSDTKDGYSSRKEMNSPLHISLKPVMASQLTPESSENNEKSIFQVAKDSTAHMDSVDKRSNITSKKWLNDHLSCGMQLDATGTEYVEETLTDVKSCLPQGTPSKYERERNNQKHENGTNHVAEGHAAVPSKSVGNEVHANGVVRKSSIAITSNTGHDVSSNSSLQSTLRIDTVPLKGSCTQKETLLENVTETEKAIQLPRSDPVSLDMKDSINHIPNFIEDTNGESLKCSADLGIESGLVRNVSDMKDTNSLILLEISHKPVIAILPKVSDSKEKVCRRSSRIASILHPEILVTNGNSEFRISKDCTACISPVYMTITSEVGLDESLTEPLGRRDRSMKLQSFKKDQQCAECMNSQSCMHRTPSKPHESADNEKCQTKLDMPGKSICGATDDMFSIENNTMPIKRQSATQNVVRKLYYTTRSGRLVGSSTNESQSLDERVKERMENVEDIPATDATSISRMTRSKNRGGVDRTLRSLKAETNGDKIVRVNHSSVKTVNDGKYKRRNLSDCHLASARAVYFTLESSTTNMQIDPAPTSDTQCGILADEQISVNTGHESEFLKSSIANKTQSDTIMGIHSTKEKILDLSITKNQNQSKRGKKKKQSPLSIYRAYKKGRSLHSSGRAIWRPSYDNQYPLTRDTAKKLSIASPESLNLKRSRSDEATVLKAIRSFPRGTACGRDGLRSQHLLDILPVVSSLNYGHVISALTSHVNLLLRADLPQVLASTLASAPLIALRKPSGGFRPIAVGEIWRRLAAKVATLQYRVHAQNYLSPIQVGVAVPLGAEAIVHAVNRTVENLKDDESRGLMKFDFANAFNTISREMVFIGVRNHFPGLSRWVEYIYAGQPTLFFGDSEISNAAGVQQGDPLGPLLFAIALQPLLLDLQANVPNLDLNSWYLDDGVIIGKKSDLLKAFLFIQKYAPAYGLLLNESKCEIWWPGSTSSSWLEFPSSIEHVCSSTIGLLGGLIISSDGSSRLSDAESYALRRVSDIKDTLHRLQALCDPHMQLLLLRSCCGYPKFNFALRTCPPACIPNAIKYFDQAIEESLTDIWNSGFSPEQRQLISLPFRHGGLNIPLASHSAISAFVGSSVQSMSLQENLMPSIKVPSLWASLALFKWNATFSADKPVALQDLIASRNPQHLLSEIANSYLFNVLLQNADPRFKTVLTAATADHSAIWTTALPIPHLGLTMSSAAFRKALLYRTGHPLFTEPRSCTACNRQAFSDTAGDHDAICQGGSRLVRRHNLLRDTLFNLARTARLAPRKEETYLLDDSADRPADILLPSWDGGRDLCIDVSIVSPFVSSWLNRGRGAAAQIAEQRKIKKYERRCEANNLLFMPFIMETSGGFGGRTEPFLRRLAVAIADVEHSDVPSILRRIRQQISFVVQRATAEGRLLVPPIAEWCQKIIYAANGEITAFTGEGIENLSCTESQSDLSRKRKRLI